MNELACTSDAVGDQCARAANQCANMALWCRQILLQGSTNAKWPGCAGYLGGTGESPGDVIRSLEENILVGTIGLEALGGHAIVSRALQLANHRKRRRVQIPEGLESHSTQEISDLVQPTHAPHRTQP